MKRIALVSIVFAAMSAPSHAQIHNGGGSLYNCWEDQWKDGKDYIDISVTHFIFKSYNATYYPGDRPDEQDIYALKAPKDGADGSGVRTEFKDSIFSKGYFDLVIYNERKDVGADHGYKAILTIGPERTKKLFNCKTGEEGESE